MALATLIHEIWKDEGGISSATSESERLNGAYLANV
jgi:hypothetical protein